MEATVTSVYDEGAIEDTPLIGAKGFSALVDVGGRRVLFDTGLRDRYLRHNLENLEIDPESIEAVVVSQAHPDNCRAINGFLDIREGPVDVYAPEGLYDRKRGMFSSSIGLSDENRAKAVLHPLVGWMEVVPGVTVTPAFDTGGYLEAFLVVQGRKITILSGRGVGGPARVLDSVRERYGRDADSFVGAVLLEKKKKPLASEYANDFLSHGSPRLLLNHCTGRDGMVNLRTSLGLNGVEEFYVGMVYKG